MRILASIRCYTVISPMPLVFRLVEIESILFIILKLLVSQLIEMIIDLDLTYIVLARGVNSIPILQMSSVDIQRSSRSLFTGLMLRMV